MSIFTSHEHQKSERKNQGLMFPVALVSTKSSSKYSYLPYLYPPIRIYAYYKCHSCLLTGKGNYIYGYLLNIFLHSTKCILQWSKKSINGLFVLKVPVNFTVMCKGFQKVLRLGNTLNSFNINCLCVPKIEVLHNQENECHIKVQTKK